jgi:hypothetical protein
MSAKPARTCPVMKTGNIIFTKTENDASLIVPVVSSKTKESPNVPVVSSKTEASAIVPVVSSKNKVPTIVPVLSS